MSQFETGKLSKKHHDELGLPYVRGITLNRSPSRHTYIIMYTDIGVARRAKHARKENVFNTIKSIIADMSAQWKASREIPEIYL